ncbi:hypothetical protein BMETH_15338533925290, partial [methanotrophic bacterial endosymbiont of Bathymodiolus sp.]
MRANRLTSTGSRGAAIFAEACFGH